MITDNIEKFINHAGCFHCIERMDEDDDVVLEIYVAMAHQKCSDENQQVRSREIYSGKLPEVFETYKVFHEVLKKKIKKAKELRGSVAR